MAVGRARGTAAAAADLRGGAGWDHKRVRNLQKLMLRSRSNTLHSVRQVTERNAGRRTAGVDGQVAVTSQAKAQLVTAIERAPRRVRPVRRVYIPKTNGKLRPIGIPSARPRYASSC